MQSRSPSMTKWPGVGILDAPDIDSVEEGNRRLAAELLDGAGLWVFVTRAQRATLMLSRGSTWRIPPAVACVSPCSQPSAPGRRVRFVRT